VAHFSMAVTRTSKRGEITAHLFSLPKRLTTILLPRLYRVGLAVARECNGADARSVLVVNQFELPNVTMALHQAQESNNDLGGRANEHLTLSALLGVGDDFQSTGKGANENHCSKWACLFIDKHVRICRN